MRSGFELPVAASEVLSPEMGLRLMVDLLEREAAVMAYNDLFLLMSWVFVIAIALTVLVRTGNPAAPGAPEKAPAAPTKPKNSVRCDPSPVHAEYAPPREGSSTAWRAALRGRAVRSI
jgi:hypothetical protein